MDDAALVDIVRRGDGKAFGDLFARHRSAVHAAVAARPADPEDRRDVVQEAFARAFQRIDGLADPHAFRAWVLQIARNAAVDHLRRAADRRPLSLDHADAAPLPSSDPEPSELAELADLATRVRTGMALLSKRDATALALTMHLGLGPADLAAALGVTPGNAKVILHRARRRLRAALDADRAAVAG